MSLTPLPQIPLRDDPTQDSIWKRYLTQQRTLVNSGPSGSYVIGDIVYANSTTTLANLADVATGNALISGGVATAPSWGKIGLTTHVSGILPVANGGTEVATASANTVFCGPATGSPAAPTFRTLDASDLGVSGSNRVLYVGSGGSISTEAAFSYNATTNTLGVDAISGATINKVTITAPATSATLTILDGKTFTVNNTITLAGTDSTTMTFPSTSATIARTDAGQTFTGNQTINGNLSVSNGVSVALTLTGTISGVVSGGTNSTTLTTYSDTASTSIVAFRAMGTLASPTTVTTGQTLFTFGGSGYNGSAFLGGNSADIVFKSSEGWTTTANGSNIIFETTPNGSSYTSKTVRLTLDSQGNAVVGSGALVTTATDGFLYVPYCSGTPTGTPTSYGGRQPIIIDNTNHKLYFYSAGSWRDAGP